MFLRSLSIGAIGVAILAWGGVAAAEQYRAGDFLRMDLSRAVLSPKPLGTGAGFTPGPLNVTMGKVAVQASAAMQVEPKPLQTSSIKAETTVVPKTALKTATSGLRSAHARTESRRQTPRSLVALHGRSPAEAQARDVKVQVWPCRSGGICNWK
jgi:hypothetical protein